MSALAWRLVGGLAVVLCLVGLLWFAKAKTEEAASLSASLEQSRLNFQLQQAATRQIEQNYQEALHAIDQAERDKRSMGQRSSKLQRELEQLQLGVPCAAEPIPVAVVERLRERVSTANQALQAGSAQPGGAHPDP
ncbi:hypothetical protein [Pseudaeromonas paramecii]|uniref:DUF2570 domain-containing protein n=1 Tax=Pseudaeromonas paramecii TaxID=2138166 RepID=A0ABP8PUC7_9GAMM